MNYKFKQICLISPICLIGLIIFNKPVTAAAPTPVLRRIIATPSATASPGARFIKPLTSAAKYAQLKGNIEAIDATYFTVDGKKVNFDAKTKLLRKFGGKSGTGEFFVGDEVQVIGTWTTDIKNEINAVIIRDLSNQKHRVVFIGTVKSLKPETAEIVLTTARHGSQNVAPDKNTKYVQRDMKVMTFEDLSVNDRIRVKGIWDNKLNQIFEVTQIKDYSLPTQTPTPTPQP